MTPPPPAALPRDTAQQLLQAFIGMTGDYAVMLLDPQGHIQSWNEGARLIHGHHADDMLGKHFSVLYMPEDVAAGKPQSALAVALSQGRVETIGYRLHKNGTPFSADMTLAPIRDAQGLLLGYGMIARDVSANPHHETGLQKLVNTILDTIIDGIITIDHQGCIRSYNKACVKLFGYTAEEVLGHNVKMLMPEPYRAEHDHYLSNYERTHRPRIIGIGREVSAQRKDGSIFPIALAVGETRQDGEHAYVGIIRDITELKDAAVAQEQLRQSRKMEALGQLTGGIAHDFNNLLAVILGNLDFLWEKTAEDGPLREFIKPAISAAERGSELTQRLLAFGRKQTLLPKVVSLNDLLVHFSPLVQRTLSERIEITLALAPDTWNVYIDPNQLENALLNLSVNARDAMPDGGKLVYETTNTILDESYTSTTTDVLPGEYVLLTVSDTGSGMDEVTIEKAFEPFFTTKEVGVGSGLGLSMVYGFVKQSAGHIRLYSEVGHGTTVKIYLPRAEGEKRDMQEKPAEDQLAQPLLHTLVLVVEDNPEVLRMTSQMVESLGYQVVTALDGGMALDILHERDDIDLLLTDVMLPGALNGPMLAQRALQFKPGLKVLFNSGYAEHAIVKSGLLDASAHLLSKPFRKAQLAKKIKEVLQG